MRRILSILGSTGSIGTQTLEVVRNNPSDFAVEGLSCGSDIDKLYEQILEFKPSVASVYDEKKAMELRERLKLTRPDISTEILPGEEGVIAVATADKADTVVGAIVGVAGLKPTVRAIEKGKDIALANKETLVAGGDIVMPLAREKGISLLPVDSEHCAIWQCLWGEKPEDLDRILITASGGPFRGRSRDSLENVSVEDALSHPTWKMGGKITIDSATMMNKGLEVIEARHLFGVGVDRVDVVVHPQSVIHSMIRMKDGSVLAQMGKPSMILPIMVALYYPDRGNRLLERFDPFDPKCCNLTFEKCDTRVFRLLDIAYDAGRAGGILPTVMNAANEIAVFRFLKGGMGFLDIERTVDHVYNAFKGRNTDTDLSLDLILDADREARIMAKEYLSKWE